MNVRFSLLLEGWYVVLKTISQRGAKHKQAWLPCLRVYKLTSLTEMEVFL